MQSNNHVTAFLTFPLLGAILSAFSFGQAPPEASVPVVVHRRVLSMPCEVVEHGLLQLDGGEPVVLLKDKPGLKLYPSALSGPFGYLEYSSTDGPTPSQETLIQTAKKAGFNLSAVDHNQEITETVRPTTDTESAPTACKDTERALQIVNTRALPKHIGTQIVGPKAISTHDPDYTAAMRRAGIQGVVRLQVLISPKGAVTVLKIIKSLNSEADAQAVNAVRKWRFEPARDNGTPIETVVQIAVTFTLQR